MRLMRVSLLCLFAILTPTRPAWSASLDIAFASLERILIDRVLTEGGRLYMEGDPESTCRYAFVQEPRVDGVGERLRITLLFAGRAGVEVGSRCVGPGDNFDLKVSGLPLFEQGELYLSEVKIEAPDTAYFKLVAPLIRRSLESRLRYPLTERLEHLVALFSASGNGVVQFDAFDVESVEVQDAGVRLAGDFAVRLEP